MLILNNSIFSEPFISNESEVLEVDHSVCTAARKIFLFCSIQIKNLQGPLISRPCCSINE